MYTKVLSNIFVNGTVVLRLTIDNGRAEALRRTKY